jgi:hypothetical protein
VLADGSTATASILLIPKKRRIYATLRCKHGGRNHRRYVGDATADTRNEALRIAWQKVHKGQLLDDLLVGARPKKRLAEGRHRP